MSDAVTNLLRPEFANPLVSVALTIGFYAMALWVHHKVRAVPPILAAAAPIIVLLFLVHEPYAAYNLGGSWLTWLLGPATVALAVPMYRNGLLLRRSLPRLLVVVTLGSVVGMATAGLTAWALGAPRAVVLSTIPKSVTTPIAIAVSRELGGIPAITVALVIVTGVLGASVGQPLLRLARIGSARAIGAAMGTSAHGIGTASLVRRSERAASVSSWSMAAAGVVTSILAGLLRLVLR